MTRIHSGKILYDATLLLKQKVEEVARRTERDEPGAAKKHLFNPIFSFLSFSYFPLSGSQIRLSYHDLLGLRYSLGYITYVGLE